jgi:hypothetical protein
MAYRKRNGMAALVIAGESWQLAAPRRIMRFAMAAGS